MIYSLEHIPKASEVRETTQPDAAAEELEWLALEATYERDPHTGMLYPKPDGFQHGRPFWRSSGLKTKPVAGVYRHPAERDTLPKRAKSPLEAARKLAGTSTRYHHPEVTTEIDP